MFSPRISRKIDIRFQSNDYLGAENTHTHIAMQIILICITEFTQTKKKIESPQIGLVSYYPYCDRDTAYFSAQLGAQG